jgi:hypothetical protein
VQPAYAVRDLEAALQALAGSIQQPAAQANAAPAVQAGRDDASSDPMPRVAEEPPACPKCGQPMVLRTAQREGPHKGRQFWGCANYPRCRGLREAALDDSE